MIKEEQSTKETFTVGCDCAVVTILKVEATFTNRGITFEAALALGEALAHQQLLPAKLGCSTSTSDYIIQKHHVKIGFYNLINTNFGQPSAGARQCLLGSTSGKDRKIFSVKKILKQTEGACKLAVGSCRFGIDAVAASTLTAQEAGMP